MTYNVIPLYLAFMGNGYFQRGGGGGGGGGGVGGKEGGGNSIKIVWASLIKILSLMDPLSEWMGTWCAGEYRKKQELPTL